MPQIRQYALLSLFLSFFVFISFLYHGVITPPPLGDSHDYHIPIAQYYLNGRILNIPRNANPYINFPGASEAILALFILFHLPVNWYCLLGWGILFILLRKLGLHFKLGNELSLIYATAFTTTLSVLRQITTQSIDMWMAVWFVLSVLLLEKPENKLSYFLKLGILLGMLSGSKGSGPVFMLILLIVYGRDLIKKVSFTNLMAFITPILIIGVSWYIRNFLEWGNPMYPIKFLVFPGVDKEISQYLLILEILKGHGLIQLQALISEYLIWGFSFIPFLYFFFRNIKNHLPDGKMNRVFFLTFLLFLYSFFFSFKPGFVSNMRYFFPVMIMLMLTIFMMTKKYKYEVEIALLAVLNSIAAVSYIIYHPKLIIIYLIICGVLYIKGKNYIEDFVLNR